MRKFVFVLLPLLCAHAAAPKKELQALTDQARALPPEFAADVLLKLAVSPLATDAKWQQELIDDAFLSAGHAPMHYLQIGDAEAAWGELSSSRMSAMTLQTRAIEAMRLLDPQRAVTLFQNLGTPELPTLSCRQPHTPDLSAYYATAAILFTQSFTPAQRQKGDDIHFLRRLVDVVQSPSQVVPALKLLDRVELSPERRDELISRFAAAMDRVHGGDREFGASELLLVSAAAPDIRHTAAFLSSLRAYIVRHIGGPRCSERMKTGGLPESAAAFNKAIARIDPEGSQFRPITAEEATPLRDDGTYPLDQPYLPAQSQRAFSKMWDTGSSERSSADRMMEYLAALEQMEEERSGDEMFPFLKAFFYVRLVQLPVTGPAHRMALGNTLHFLERQYDTLQSRDLWFQLYLQVFGTPRTNDADYVWLMDQLVHSRNPIISVYAQLEKLLIAS